jgi:hypothetical protein
LTVEGSITSEDVVSILKEAGAKEPWADLSLCSELAETLNALAGLVQYARENKRPVLRRAQEAIDELRRVLPEVIAMEVVMPGFFGLSDPEYEQISQDRLRRLVHLDKALEQMFDLVFRLPNGRIWEGLPGHWHQRAGVIFDYYLRIVGPSGISREGPGVRFVRLALERIGDAGPGRAEHAAIEEALLKYRRAGKLNAASKSATRNGP